MQAKCFFCALHNVITFAVTNLPTTFYIVHDIVHVGRILELMLVGGLFVDVESQAYPRYIFAVFVSKRHIFQLNRCAERDPLFKLMDFKKKIKKIDSQNQKLEKLRDGIRKK